MKGFAVYNGKAPKVIFDYLWNIPRLELWNCLKLPIDVAGSCQCEF